MYKYPTLNAKSIDTNTYSYLNGSNKTKQKKTLKFISYQRSHFAGNEETMSRYRPLSSSHVVTNSRFMKGRCSRHIISDRRNGIASACPLSITS